jgi:hypothetical protein
MINPMIMLAISIMPWRISSLAGSRVREVKPLSMRNAKAPAKKRGSICFKMTVPLASWSKRIASWERVKIFCNMICGRSGRRSM